MNKNQKKTKEGLFKGDPERVLHNRIGVLIYSFAALFMARCSEIQGEFSGRSTGDGVTAAENTILFPLVIYTLYLAGFILLIAFVLSFFQGRK